MTTEQQVAFAIKTVSDTKSAIISNGVVDAQLMCAVCNRLSDMLMISVDQVIEIFERV